MKRHLTLGAALIAVLAGPAFAQTSLDLGVEGFGISIGNSRRWNGLRINLVDHEVEEVYPSPLEGRHDEQSQRSFPLSYPVEEGP